MANTPSAKKRIRGTERKTVRNKMRRSKLRTAVRGAREALAQTAPAAAHKAVMEAISHLDKAAGKRVIHRKNAARRKGRLMKQLSALENKK
ncbi:MAG: ribosomal protein [Chloroflexota bacterium]